METFLGEYQADVERAAAELERADVPGRLWRKDHTVWQPEPDEITNRLGWLDLPEYMPKRVREVTAFAREVRQAGFRHIVLLGMGGSSLAPEVFRQTFAWKKGYPELIVLDSTVPETIRAVTAEIEPERTLFLVSSKSGTTLETVSLLDYYREMVGASAGVKNTGGNFAAITDPGTPLAERAAADGYRHVFLNEPDMGGRYSALSYFGLVPAVLMGVDTEALLERAAWMHRECAPGRSLVRNPGAWLGVIMGRLYLAGRDKLTILASPAVAGFGLWVEQLVAESTGKKGRGIVPVIGEPLAAPEDYGNDRLFVYLRLEGDDNTGSDAAVRRLRSAGHPVAVIALADRYDLGAEFFRWQMATAVAGAMLGVNPFYQPDVEATKQATVRILEAGPQDGRRELPEDNGAAARLLAGAGGGEYLAILAYLPPTAEVEAALAEMRRQILNGFHIATTLGYGPRYLHSTGQLHKGGPVTGLFLQLTVGHETDLPVPGAHYTFGQLVDTQAAADRQILEGAGRRVAWYHLDKLSDVTGLSNLCFAQYGRKDTLLDVKE